MPCTTTQNTSTGMIIVMSLMKPSLSGLSLTPNSGQVNPTTTPTNRASKTWPKSERSKRGMVASGSLYMFVDDKLVCNECTQIDQIRELGFAPTPLKRGGRHLCSCRTSGARADGHAAQGVDAPRPHGQKVDRATQHVVGARRRFETIPDDLDTGQSMDLTRFARRRYTEGATPMEPLPRFSNWLGGPEVWIKRDDLLGLSPGG